MCVSEVRRGALPVSNMLLPLWETLQSLPAAEGPQLFLATGSLPVSQMLRGIKQVSMCACKHTWENTHTHHFEEMADTRVPSTVCVRLAEGEQVLIGGVLNKQKSQDDIITEFGESASFTLSLLGHIYW